MRTTKRKAKVGERILITDSQKGWNQHDGSSNGKIMTVNRVIVPGVYTDEFSSAIYINHEGYEVIEEDSD